MPSSLIARDEHRHPVTPRSDEMLTFDEARAYLRIPEGTLRYWRHLGTGPRSFKIGRHVRYWRSDLERWLAEQAEPDAASHGSHDRGREPRVRG